MVGVWKDRACLKRTSQTQRQHNGTKALEDGLCGRPPVRNRGALGDSTLLRQQRVARHAGEQTNFVEISQNPEIRRRLVTAIDIPPYCVQAVQKGVTTSGVKRQVRIAR